MGSDKDLKNSPLGLAFANHISYLDIDFYLSILCQFKEDVWFAPSNRCDESFTVCEHFAMEHLICKRVVPIWLNGSFGGNKVEFLYNRSLNYSKVCVII